MAGPLTPPLAFNDHTSMMMLGPAVPMQERPFDLEPDYPTADTASPTFRHATGRRAPPSEVTPDACDALAAERWSRRPEVPATLERRRPLRRRTAGGSAGRRGLSAAAARRVGRPRDGLHGVSLVRRAGLPGRGCARARARAPGAGPASSAAYGWTSEIDAAGLVDLDLTRSRVWAVARWLGEAGVRADLAALCAAHAPGIMTLCRETTVAWAARAADA